MGIFSFRKANPDFCKTCGNQLNQFDKPFSCFAHTGPNAPALYCGRCGAQCARGDCRIHGSPEQQLAVLAVNKSHSRQVKVKTKNKKLELLEATDIPQDDKTIVTNLKRVVCHVLDIEESRLDWEERDVVKTHARRLICYYLHTKYEWDAEKIADLFAVNRTTTERDLKFIKERCSEGEVRTQCEHISEFLKESR